MRKFIYRSLLAPSLLQGYRLIGARNDKAKEYFAVRAGMMERLAEARAQVAGRPVLVHVASVGELLQAMPVMAAIKNRTDAPAVALSYTSPSVARNFPRGVAADIITPSPLDTSGEVRRFFDLLNPRLIIFSTYDLWPGLVWEARERGTPMTLINASLPENSGRLGFPARWFYRDLYAGLRSVGAVTIEDADRHRRLGVDWARVTGNCRFDQTLARCRAVADDDPDVAALPRAEFTLIAGSTWPEDHRHFLPAVETLLARHPGLSVVIAPHEPSAAHLAEVEGFFRERGREVVRYKRLRDEGAAPARVVLVDCVGVLYKLYKRGQAAYVGGSFHQGVHSVMEPAGMGLPVIVGPVHQNSAEALLMIKTGGAVAVNDRAGLEAALERMIEDPDHGRKAGAAALAVVENNAGATARTMEMLEEFLGPGPG